MKIIYNNIIPFRGYIACNIFGIIFIRKKYKPYMKSHFKKITLNHELIHSAQMKELWYIGFYFLYLYYWITKGYYKNPFEIEAYKNESNPNYLNKRKKFNWKK